MAVQNGRADWAMLNGRAGWPGRAGRPIGGVVTLAIMPDRRDISGDPGPVRVSPAPSLPPAAPGPPAGPLVGRSWASCAARNAGSWDAQHAGCKRVLGGAAHAMGNESNGEVVRAADRCATKWGDGRCRGKVLPRPSAAGG